jgi:DNA-binding LytR/AlgR family response regulator
LILPQPGQEICLKLSVLGIKIVKPLNMSIMARYPMKASFSKQPPNPQQLLKRNAQHRRNFRQKEMEKMLRALEDKPAVVMVQIEGHYLYIKNIKGKECLLILPFAEAKKHLRSVIFYRANPSTIVNLYYVEKIRQDDEGSWLILPHKCQAKLYKDDEKSLKDLQELLLDTRIFKEIRRLSGKRNCR